MSFLRAADFPAAPALGVAGLVTGRTGIPKALVGVNFRGPNNYAAITDSQGRFQLGDIKPGRYVITVSQGHNRQQFIRVLQVGEQLHLEVRW